jgi:hypothetical protein
LQELRVLESLQSLCTKAVWRRLKKPKHVFFLLLNPREIRLASEFEGTDDSRTEREPQRHWNPPHFWKPHDLVFPTVELRVVGLGYGRAPAKELRDE